MKCLLVSYAPLANNSTSHVIACAASLVHAGHSVYVAVISRHPKRSGEYQFLQIVSATGKGIPAPEASLRPFDVVHFWTPRGAIWRFLSRHRRLIEGSRAFLHLEDDEDEVLELYAGSRYANLLALHPLQMRWDGLEHWSHPALTRVLASSCAGVSLISPYLKRFLPDGQVSQVLLPALIENSEPRAYTGNRGKYIIFSGGVHPGISADLRNLYIAVSNFRRRSRSDIKLIRTGSGTLADAFAYDREVVIDLGFVPERRLVKLMNSAIALVQPGKINNYNLSRFPSKIPAYLTSQTPVIMPAFYDWTGIRDQEHVLFLRQSDPEEIEAALATILSHPRKWDERAAAAKMFADQRFSLERCSADLQRLYDLADNERKILSNMYESLPRSEISAYVLEGGANVAGISAAQLGIFISRETRSPASQWPRAWQTLSIRFGTRFGFTRFRSFRKLIEVDRWTRFRLELLRIRKADQVMLRGRIGGRAIQVKCADFWGADGTWLGRKVEGFPVEYCQKGIIDTFRRSGTLVTLKLETADFPTARYISLWLKISSDSRASEAVQYKV